MNADLDRLYIWAAENGLCLNPEKSQAIAYQVFSFPNNTFLINIVCRRVYFTLKRLCTTASLTPVGTRLQLARSLVVPLFLYCDVIFSKVAVVLAASGIKFLCAVCLWYS
jgi:hypothetical protein